MNISNKKTLEQTASTPHDDEDDWANSSIFSTSNVFGLDPLTNSAIEASSMRMDENQLRLAASVFSSTHDGIVITDANGIILDVNRAFTKMTGFSPKEVIGQFPSILESEIHPSEYFEEIWSTLRQKGYWRGEIWNKYSNGELHPDLVSISKVVDVLGEITHYVAIYTDITALKDSQKKLEHLAYYDALTHLPNRVLLADRIQQAISHAVRNNKLLAVCFLDLDHFKPVNDNYGHQVGDRLLLEVANILGQAIRSGDTVARIGGDEFALLLTDIESPEFAMETLLRLLEKLRNPIRIGNLSISISASIGYTLVPLDRGDTDYLLRHADQAMYVAKQEGRNRVHRFDMEHDQRVQSHSENLSRVQQALHEHEFRLFYQPKVDMRRGEVVGVEALIRWQHPELGLRIPADFLLTLGDHALLADIGDWVIGEALKQLSIWQGQGARLSMGVNIAGSHLLHPEFVTRLTQHLAAYPEIDPACLELEILETAALDDINHVSYVIDKCREIGVRFALDDFGTGYSSLIYLKRLQVKTLKIDQSFVRDMLDDPEDLAIVSGILGLASAFNREPVAEGLETVEHGILLLNHDCNIAQGYGISRPMPPEDFPAWLSRFVPDPSWQDSLERVWRRTDFPLLAAPIEQERWLSQVIAAVERKDSRLPENNISNLYGSRFGRWLARTAQSDYADLPLVKDMPTIYRKAHRVSAEISIFLGRGEHDRARALLDQQRQRSRELIAALRELLELIAPSAALQFP